MGCVHYSFPVIFSGTGLIPPASAVNYVPWAIVGFIFQYVIRRRHFSWWTKYNCASLLYHYSFHFKLTLSPLCLTDVLSAALDAGVAIAAVLIFFMLQYPRNGTIGADSIQVWWGNTVYTNTADNKGTPMLTLADGQDFFGPRSW
jgi:hypothetical protein